MNTPATTSYSSAGSRTLTALGEMLTSMMSLVERLDVFLVAQRRAAQDREALASMSDRGLKDIGVSRASVDAVANGTWTRDWPR
jgi:uncharacterized protein YjiS (DUF1127 family)